MRPAVLLTATLAFAGVAGSEPLPEVPSQALPERPANASLSPLQARVDAAEPGATILVEGGEHRGDLWIDKPLRLVGRGRPRLMGSGDGSVVFVRAADVLVEGFDIDGLGGGNLGEDASSTLR